VFPCCSLVRSHEMTRYARDPIGETSACDLALVLAVERRHGEPCCRGEVFPSGGTAWGDDSVPSRCAVSRGCWGDTEVGSSVG